MELSEEEAEALRALVPHVPKALAIMGRMTADPEGAAKQMDDVLTIVQAAAHSRWAFRMVVALLKLVILVGGALAAAYAILHGGFRQP